MFLPSGRNVRTTLTLNVVISDFSVVIAARRSMRSSSNLRRSANRCENTSTNVQSVMGNVSPSARSRDSRNTMIEKDSNLYFQFQKIKNSFIKSFLFAFRKFLNIFLCIHCMFTLYFFSMEKLSKKEQVVLQKVREYLTNSEKITIRALQSALGYASPRSISVLLDQIMLKWWLYRDSRDELQLSPDFTTGSYEVRSIPLIGTVACGMPIFAEENIETQIPVSTKIVNQTDKYFFLRAQGDSMNQKWIDDGDLVLVKQTNIARNGEIIVILINDEATLKEFRQEKGSTYLIPHSDNSQHKPIILDESDGNIMIQWTFVRAFPWSLFT